MSHVLLTRSKVLIGSLLALALLVTGSLHTVKADHMEGPRIGLEGYCPVCILDANKWVKGSPEYQATYDGVTYHFPEEAIKEKFLANPAKYVPALGGDCIVCYASSRAVPGSVNHTVRYDNRLFLFPGAEQQQAFRSNPKEFADVDLVLTGWAGVPVELAPLQKGCRLEACPTSRRSRTASSTSSCPPANKRPAARTSADAVAPASRPVTHRPQRSQRPTGNGLLTVTGKTACAGCEHGVAAVRARKSSGLAVNTDDGKVVNIKQAHKLFSVTRTATPGNRCRSGSTSSSGEVASPGIEPTELMVQK